MSSDRKKKYFEKLFEILNKVDDDVYDARQEIAELNTEFREDKFMKMEPSSVFEFNTMPTDTSDSFEESSYC